jgi:cysteine desulfurase
MPRIHLDHASFTPLDPEVRRTIISCLEEESENASGYRASGVRAREVVDSARAAVASLVHASPEEIVLTASASEANNLALKGIALRAGGRRHIVSVRTEHLSVLHPLRTLERQGFRVSLLEVDGSGLVDPEDVRRAIGPETCLVSVAHANGEIGTVQALEEVCRVAHEAGVLLHTDAAMSAGRVPLPQGPHRPDLLSLTASLFHGPQGVGALLIRKGVPIAPLIEGGTQEGGLRAGTQPVATIAGLATAARLAAERLGSSAERASLLASRLRSALLSRIESLVMTGHEKARLPGHLSLCVGGVEAEALVQTLEQEGVEAATGSACATEIGKPSHVLLAIGVDPVLARGAVVFCFGEASREDDPEAAAPTIETAIRRLRRLSPLAPS